MFVDPQSLNFHLQTSSPCIGTGRYGADRGGLPYGPTAISEDDALPSSIALLGNYPNPFNASTVISFSLDQPSNVLIEVFDLRGARVAVACAGHFESGHHSIRWAADALPSGMYFYQLKAGWHVLSGKMVMLK